MVIVRDAWEHMRPNVGVDHIKRLFGRSTETIESSKVGRPLPARFLESRLQRIALLRDPATCKCFGVSWLFRRILPNLLDPSDPMAAPKKDIPTTAPPAGFTKQVPAHNKLPPSAIYQKTLLPSSGGCWAAISAPRACVCHPFK